MTASVRRHPETRWEPRANARNARSRPRTSTGCARSQASRHHRRCSPVIRPGRIECVARVYVPGSPHQQPNDLTHSEMPIGAWRPVLLRRRAAFVRFGQSVYPYATYPLIRVVRCFALTARRGRISLCPRSKSSSRHTHGLWTTSAASRPGGTLDDCPTGVEDRLVRLATKWALDNYLNGISLEELINADFDWREGWEYTVPVSS